MYKLFNKTSYKIHYYLLSYILMVSIYTNMNIIHDRNKFIKIYNQVFDIKNTDDLVFFTGSYAKKILDYINEWFDYFITAGIFGAINSQLIERILKLILISLYLKNNSGILELFTILSTINNSYDIIKKLELYIVSPDLSKMVELNSKEFEKWKNDSSNNVFDQNVFLNFIITL